TEERRDGTSVPGGKGEALIGLLMVMVGEMRVLPGLMDDVATVQKHGCLEQSVRNQMEDCERKSAQSTFHDHVTHLADCGETERFLDVVLRQHHAGTEDGCQGADGEGDVEGRRAQPEERRQPVDQKPAGIDDSAME